MQMGNSISETSKRRNLRFLELLKKLMHVCTQLRFQMVIQSKQSFSGVKFKNTSINNCKPLFEVNFSKNSTETIRLFPLDFFEVIVD